MIAAIQESQILRKIGIILVRSVAVVLWASMCGLFIAIGLSKSEIIPGEGPVPRIISGLLGIFMLLWFGGLALDEWGHSKVTNKLSIIAAQVLATTGSAGLCAFFGWFALTSHNEGAAQAMAGFFCFVSFCFFIKALGRY
jgi:hypothetical protein